MSAKHYTILSWWALLESAAQLVVLSVPAATFPSPAQLRLREYHPKRSKIESRKHYRDSLSFTNLGGKVETGDTPLC